jgi:hypothetical protein
MWADSVWGLFTLGVGFWLAMIGPGPGSMWLHPWFLYRRHKLLLENHL